MTSVWPQEDPVSDVDLAVDVDFIGPVVVFDTDYHPLGVPLLGSLVLNPNILVDV